ncbi:acyltransferase family protein [Lacrimispora sp. 38-1]|uniref:acyltransferase family protein n=1 Tax=Lacrimispora sp. 38-1 TaxID=3125778 RepID=UPI003CEA2770
MEEKYFRNKVIWFTFLYSILVIWVHSYNAVLFLGKTTIAYRVDMLERFWGDTVAQIAVPGFFLISSYLFFRGFTMEKLWVKWNSRIRSILVPYIMWNLLYYLGYVIGSRIPFISRVIGKGRIPFNFQEAAQAVLHYSYNYVFWYLNQLLLLVLLAPVIYMAVRKKEIGMFLLAGILAVIYMGGALPFLNLDALFYYTFGAYAAIHGKDIVERSFSRKHIAVGAVLFLAACLAKNIDIPGNVKGEIAASTVCFRFLMPVSLWLMVPGRYLKEANDWMKQNFYLYATHFSVVRLINKTGALLLPPIPAVTIGLYIIMPVFCILFSCITSSFLRKYLSTVWCLFNGGR